MKIVSNPYRWLWRTWYKNVASWRWDIYNGIRNLFIFFEAVWWFRPWDWEGLAHLIEVSTTQMRRVQEHGIHEGSKRYAKQLLIIQNLCRRLREDDYFENAGYNHETWKQVDDFQARKISEHSMRMARNDAVYLGKMFKFMQCWWE